MQFDFSCLDIDDDDVVPFEPLSNVSKHVPFTGSTPTLGTPSSTSRNRFERLRTSDHQSPKQPPVQPNPKPPSSPPCHTTLSNHPILISTVLTSLSIPSSLQPDLQTLLMSLPTSTTFNLRFFAGVVVSLEPQPEALLTTLSDGKGTIHCLLHCTVLEQFSLSLDSVLVVKNCVVLNRACPVIIVSLKNLVIIRDFGEQEVDVDYSSAYLNLTSSAVS
ncbi:hypothetical protein P9112_013074 [Eukaryota sp. TZLM1-RC]